MKQIFILGVVAVVAMVSPVSADSLDTALKTGFGVRALSMGGAQTAVPNSDSGIFFNPGILARQPAFYEYDSMDFKRSTYTQWDAHRGKFGPLGFGYHTVKLSDSDHSTVTSVGFGRPGNRGVDWGVTYKSIVHKINGETKTGWSTDLGILANMSKNMWVGLVVQDVVGDGLSLPVSVRAGVSVFAGGDALLLTSDVVYFRYRAERQFEPHFGAEYQVAPGLVVRGGWFDDSSTGGVDIVFPWVQVSYGVISEAKGKRETMHLVGVSFIPPRD